MFQLPFPIRDAAEPTGGEFGDLPDWNLDDLYPGQDSAELKTDLEKLKAACASFASDYEGELDGLTADGMLNCIERYEDIQNVSGRIMSFAGLRKDADRANLFCYLESFE